MKYGLCVITVFLGLLTFSISVQAADPSMSYKVDMYPQKLSGNCRGGVAKVYDECSSQMGILRKGLKRANQTGKSVLLVYGAEWCIWCHVFDKYIKGKSRTFHYEFEEDGELQKYNLTERDNLNAEIEATALNKYVAENFVVVHIEADFSPDGADVINYIGFDINKVKYYPFIFSLKNSGKYAAYMTASDAIPGLEIREDGGEAYRGYDRKILLSELVKLREKAQ